MDIGGLLLDGGHIKEFRVSSLSIIARLSTKMNKRIFATIIGIAFCVTYLAGTSAMVGGLNETTATVAATFDQGPILIYSDEDFALSSIDSEDLPENVTNYVAFSFVNVTLKDNYGKDAENIYVVSIFDPEDILGLNMTNESYYSPVLVGTQLQEMLRSYSIQTGTLERYWLTYNNQTANVQINALYPPGSIFPDDWLLVPRNVIDTLKPEMSGDYSFLMIINTEMSSDDIWNIDGTNTKPTSGVVGFFEEGIHQVEDDLWTIIMITGLITSLLVYCIISIETEYNAPTIKILRGVGATRTFVIKIFILKSMFITLMGGILGTALGFCTASAISSASSVFGVMTFITPVATLNSILMPIFIALVSGLIGGFWPAVRASKMFSLRRNER
jgi:hypothetical protein